MENAAAEIQPTDTSICLAYTFLLCCLIRRDIALNQYFNIKGHCHLISSPSNPPYTHPAACVLLHTKGGTASVNYTLSVILLHKVS